MTDDSSTVKPRPDAPAPTEYYHYAPTPGGSLYVMAEQDNPEPQDKFFDEYRAYDGLRGVPPRPLDPTYLPKKFTLHKKRQIPPMFLTRGFVVVDGAVRSAIEALEPGRHQFIPVTMIHANGEAEPRDFFILNVHHTADAMALEEMGVKRRTSPDGSVSSLALPTGYFAKAVKLRRTELDGAGHLFTDRRCGSPPAPGSSPGKWWTPSNRPMAASTCCFPAR